MNAQRQPSIVDVHVGYRLQSIRIARGLSKADLGKAAGVTFQQIQKYELGVNRISASKLWVFATTLGVDVAAFFEGLESDGDSGFHDVLAKEGASVDVMRDPYAIKLCLVSSKIKSKKQRQRLLDLARRLSKTETR